ncbi:GNAT family N-acetyltransferase [Inconstantimicrobium mannanitabidum]|uniref:N-acetyltransferase n=1 Tax=Inconstantimicrobium mannanitabidum TaxID=1604901 RepID=A0ACB5RB43_9CLOT|nr:GNAT family N-acetyltransferase [Clostridium sp. TW13]GKX66413.1 N-acetyltransferase [Clostridium sp. TW13]
MFGIRFVESNDKEFWYSLDKHLPNKEFEKKVRDKMGYIILEDEKPIGILRYNLFWDNTPFLTLIFIDWSYHKKGFGRKAMDFWEQEMKNSGYGMIMVSTQVDENAQHFYRKLGYKDCGCLVMDIPQYEQPLEMFMVKAL